jgi:secreted trypsin-like serine protease
MKKVTMLIAVVLVLAVAASPAAAITWGEPDTAHSNVGAIVVNYPRYGLYQICSGTLIHPRVFLTAGHCTVALADRPTGTIFVNFNPYALKPDTLLAVEQVITHPEYNWGPQSNPHDAGVLILAEPVTGIEPATLPDEGFLEDLRAAGVLNEGKTKAKFTVVGYGGTLAWPPPEITYDDQRQFAASEYRALLDAWLRMSQNHATDDGGTCYGDSGGPAFYTEPDGSEVLVGITSWGDAQCVSSGFNYRVDIPDTLDFIASVIDALQ